MIVINLEDDMSSDRTSEHNPSSSASEGDIISGLPCNEMRPILIVTLSLSMSLNRFLFLSHIHVHNLYIHDMICGNALVETEKKLTTEFNNQNNLASSLRDELSMLQRSYYLAFVYVRTDTTCCIKYNDIRWLYYCSIN